MTTITALLILCEVDPTGGDDSPGNVNGQVTRYSADVFFDVILNKPLYK